MMADLFSINGDAADERPFYKKKVNIALILVAIICTVGTYGYLIAASHLVTKTRRELKAIKVFSLQLP